MRDTLRSGPPVRHGMHPAPDEAFGEKAESERDLTSDRAMSRDAESRSYTANKRRSNAHDDDPFGDEGDNEVKYRTLRWW